MIPLHCNQLTTTTMNENLDLTKILKDCPKGAILWSPIFGDVKFDHVGGDIYVGVMAKDHYLYTFETDGCYIHCEGSEVLLFPSRDQRDWSKFDVSAVTLADDHFFTKESKSEKPTNETEERLKAYFTHVANEIASDIKNRLKDNKSPNTKPEHVFKPFDRVLVREGDDYCWEIGFFDHYNQNNYFPYRVMGHGYCKQCLPYEGNEHLLGTTDKPKMEEE